MVIFLHGYNVWDGGIQTVGKLRSFFVTYPNTVYVMMNYGHFTLIETRFKNDGVAKRLSKAVTHAKEGGFRVIVVGHSNAGSIIHRASNKYPCPIDKAVLINPALRAKLAPGECIKSVDVWHSPSDKAVKFAKWIPFRRAWGEMGSVGYQGDDPRITNYNKEKDFPVSSDEHSDVFTAEKITYFGPLIAEIALRRVILPSEPGSIETTNSEQEA